MERDAIRQLGIFDEVFSMRRMALLKVLKDRLKRNVFLPTLYACLWLSDIEKLQRLADKAVKSGYDSFSLALAATDLNEEIVEKWTQRNDTDGPDQYALGRMNVLRFNGAAAGQSCCSLCPHGRQNDARPRLVLEPSAIMCKERDQRRCVITNAADPVDAVRIYPVALQNTESGAFVGGDHFWQALRLFWADERVEAWKEAISWPQLNAVRDRICLSASARRYYEQGLFALKPIGMSPNKEVLTVKFFWMTPTESSSSAVEIMRRPSIQQHTDQCRGVKLYNVRTNEVIRPGDEIVLTTKDPERFPLPDLRVLEMQWFMQRVAAFSGAGERLNDIIPVDGEHDSENGTCHKADDVTERGHLDLKEERVESVKEDSNGQEVEFEFAEEQPTNHPYQVSKASSDRNSEKTVGSETLAESYGSDWHEAPEAGSHILAATVSQDDEEWLDDEDWVEASGVVV